MRHDDEQPKEAPRDRRGRRMAIVTVAGFLLAVWLPLVAIWVLPRPSLSFTEKRFLARWPAATLSRASIEAWPRGVEAWFDDRLGFRDFLIRNWARLHLGLFGVSPAELLVVGKDGWMFLGDRDAIENYRGLAPLTPRELETWRRVTEERRDWLAERGIAYLLVLVPDKHLVYAEHMPDALPRVSDVHPLDQLARHLGETSDVAVLDLRAPLQSAKQRERIYHKTDSHWNDLGAWEAYRAIHTRLQAMLPALADVPPAAVATGRHEAPGLGLASVVGLADRYPEDVIEAPLVAPRAAPRRKDDAAESTVLEEMRPLVYEQPDASRPRAVMFRDSFGNALIPYVAEDFSRTVFVWERDVDPDVVLRERPDVVVHEIVGRFLGRRPKGIEEVRERKAQRRRR